MLGEAGDATGGQVNGMFITACAFEGNGTAIDFVGGVAGAFVQGMYVLGETTTIGGIGSQTSQYGLRLRDNQCKYSTFIDNQIYNDIAVAGIYVGEMTGNTIRAGNLFQGNVSDLSGAGTDWVFPTATQWAAGYTFIGNNSQPSLVFADLPTTTNRVEGDEYSITNGNTATWGATCAGGGVNHVKIRFNGTNWTVTGA